MANDPPDVAADLAEQAEALAGIHDHCIRVLTNVVEVSVGRDPISNRWGSGALVRERLSEVGTDGR